MTIKFDWNAFEELLTQNALDAIQRIVQENNINDVYVVAFHEIYMETDGVIYPPMLAINHETHRKEKNVDWCPPDWRWADIKYINAREIEKLLTEEACKKTNSHWEATERKFKSSLVKCAKNIYKTLKNEIFTTKDFIVYVETNDDDQEEVMRKCVPAKLLNKIFPQYNQELVERSKVAALNVHEKIIYHMENIAKSGSVTVLSYDESMVELIKIGQPAVSHLLNKLKSRSTGWIMAKTLALMNINSKEIIDALREESINPKSESFFWSPAALSMLDDDEFLISIIMKEINTENIIQGICLKYKTWDINFDFTIHKNLDYTTLENILELNNKKLNSLIHQELRSGSLHIHPDDIEIAIKGLNSQHQVIRQHAVWALYETKNLNKSTHKFMPHLIIKLTDDDPEVRRRAKLSILSWKKYLTPFKSNIQALKAGSVVSTPELDSLIADIF